jgi:hypothetical protein
MNSRVVLLLTVLPFALFAEGIHTCTVPQSQISTRAGVERPTTRAYDTACIAVLPPACRDYTVDHKPCAYRACLVPDSLRTCPDGSPPSFTAATIEPLVAKTVKPVSAEQLAAMNRNIDAEARRLAAKWTDNGRVPLSPAALTALRNLSCQLAAANNPDVRCVTK